MEDILKLIPMTLSTILTLALIVQFIVERIKGPIPTRYRSWVIPIISFIISIILTVCCKIGFLISLGIVISPVIIDYILTGLIISGGSALVNELIKVLQGVKEVLQSTLATTTEITHIIKGESGSVDKKDPIDNNT